MSEGERRRSRKRGGRGERRVCAKVWSGQWLELSGEKEGGAIHHSPREL